MGADRHQINAKRSRLYFQLAEPLHAIAVEQCGRSRPLNGPTHSIQWLEGADLIVDRHHADQNGIAIDRLKKIFPAHLTIFSSGEENHLKPLPLQLPHRFFHTWMLDRRRHNPVAPACKRLCRAKNGQVVRFRPAGGEKHFLRRTTNAPCHALTSLPEQPLSLKALGMEGGWVSIALCKGI